MGIRGKGEGPVGLGLRALRGGAAIVGIAIGGGTPRLLVSAFLATHEEGDRLSLEPYAVAAGMARRADGGASAEAAAAVGEGRARQDRLAAAGLRGHLHRLAGAGYETMCAALLVNRAGWVGDVLAYSLAWPDHVPVAEGLAVREALRSGLKDCGIDTVELDEKSLPDLAEQALGLSPAEIAAQLKVLGAAAGKPWRKEQKAACLAAWIAAAGQGRAADGR